MLNQIHRYFNFIIEMLYLCVFIFNKGIECIN